MGNENRVFGVNKARRYPPKSQSIFAMKSAAEYLESHVFEARRPRRDLQPVVAYSVAVQAIEQALADAEKYKYLLMRALRHHADATGAPQTVPVVPSFFVGDAAMLPLYPIQGRLAA